MQKVPTRNSTLHRSSFSGQTWLEELELKTKKDADLVTLWRDGGARVRGDGRHCCLWTNSAGEYGF